MNPVTTARELLESECRYFESGAIVEDWDGAVMARMEGLEDLAVGCIVQRVEPSRISGPPGSWLAMAERKLKRIGCAWARFYLNQPSPSLEGAFLQRGYRARKETGLVLLLTAGARQDSAVVPEVSLHPVERESDWLLKLELHRTSRERPDGHEASAERWIELERRKVEAGYMRPFLLKREDDVCGAFSLAPGHSMTRLKNLFVHAAFRRAGVGRQAIRLLGKLAEESGLAAIGSFALVGGPGESMHRRAGFEPVVEQTEWLKPC